MNVYKYDQKINYLTDNIYAHLLHLIKKKIFCLLLKLWYTTLNFRHEQIQRCFLMENPL